MIRLFYPADRPDIASFRSASLARLTKMLALERPYSPWIHVANTDLRGPWTILQRVLAHYLLVVSYEGSEELIVRGQSIGIPENGAYLIQPGVLAEQIGSEKGSRPAYLHFDVVYNPRRDEHGDTRSFATDLADRSHLLQPSSLEVWGVDLPVRVPQALQPLFARKVDAIIGVWKRGHPYDQLEANQELADLLLALVRHQDSKGTAAPGVIDPEMRLRRAEATAQTSLSRPFGVDDFAEAAGLHRAQFTRLYWELRGTSPGSALREMRLTEAERLLQHTPLSVQEVGRQVGYPNQTVLGRSFKKRHGITPTEWRTKR